MMDHAIIIALIFSAELIFHFLALYIIFKYSLWEQEQALLNSAASSFDISEQATASLEEGGENASIPTSKLPLTNRQSATFRAVFIWLLAAALVTDWTIFLFIGLALLAYERYRSTKKRGRLPYGQLRIYLFTVMALFAVLVATMGMMLWTFRSFFGIIQEDAGKRHRIVSIIGAFCSIILGFAVISVCSSHHGPTQVTSHDYDEEINENKESSFIAMG
jgi:hypothetical protein